MFETELKNLNDNYKATIHKQGERIAELEAKLAESDNELRRWQDAIRDQLIVETGCEWIDGSGCDSGDPLDLTLSEVSQGVNYLQEKLAAREWLPISTAPKDKDILIYDGSVYVYFIANDAESPPQALLWKPIDWPESDQCPQSS